MIIRQDYALGSAVPLDFGYNCELQLESNEQLLSDNLVAINTVRQGEILLYDDFGTPMQQVLFEMNDIVLYMLLDTYFRSVTSTFEPRVVISKVTASQSTTDGHVVNAIVSWLAKPSNAQSVTNVAYPSGS